MRITNLEIARIAVTALGIDLEDSLEWLSKNRPDGTEEISGYEIGNILTKMDDEIFDHNNSVPWVIRRGNRRNGGINDMIRTFLLSNLPEFQEMLQIDNSDYVTLEVVVDSRTGEYQAYGNNFDLTVQERLGEGVLSKEDLDFLGLRR